MNTREYAKLLGVSQRTVQRWILNGQIDAEKVGNRYQITEEITAFQQPPSEAAERRYSEPESSSDFSTREYAEEIGVSQRTVQRRIQNGELYAFKVAGKWRIPAEQTDDFSGGYVPEKPEEEEEDDFEVTDEDQFAPEDLRKEFTTFQETEDYAIPIPVPFEIIKNKAGLYRVVIQYDIVVVDAEEEEE